MAAIRVQIVERPGADLFRVLRAAMRTHSLRTFHTKNRGKRVYHSNPEYTARMNWSHLDGVITCSIVSPRRPGGEWQFLSAFLGRLADRYADSIVNISIQFVGDGTPRARRAKRARKR